LSERRTSLFVVSGREGAAPATVGARLLAEDATLRFSISHTTRPPRVGERDGVHYHFVERAAFEDLVRQDAMLEWADVHGHLYGTSRAELGVAERERRDLLLDLDVQGAAQVRERVPESVSVFLFPPSFEDLERRLRGRGLDAGEVIERRLRNARGEVEAYRGYDYVVVNDDLDRAVDALKCVIGAARCRRSRVEAEAERILGSFRARD
jgi:guanylate kinase